MVGVLVVMILAGNSNPDSSSAGSACNDDSQCADGLICTVDFVCAQSDGSAGSACNDDSYCADGLICARVSGSRVCAQSDGSAGSVCGFDDSQCADGLICARVSGSNICSAVGDGSAGSVCGRDYHCDYSCDFFGTGQCTDGSAGSLCLFDSDCADGLICPDIVCVSTEGRCR